MSVRKEVERRHARFRHDYAQPTVSITAIGPYLPEVLGLAAGGIGSAAYGARLITALSVNRLVQLIAGLLAAIGCLLLVEALSPFHHAELLPGMFGGPRARSAADA